MEKFQIVEVTEQFNHAGTKATADIARIADRLGFQRINIKMDTTDESTIGKLKRQIGYYRDWRRAKQQIIAGSVLLLQHPFHHKQLTREKTLHMIKDRDVKIISLVHDVEELRAFRYSEYYKHEFATMLELADVIIVHNDVMKEWFVKQGIEERKLVSLGIFDYIQEEHSEKEFKFEKSITVAGNLHTTKCGYIEQLGNIEGVKVHLYGPNFNNMLSKYESIKYHGSFPVDEIPKKLDRGFGLVWDGNSIDGCQGQSGQYLRYNNPHKLSLYLSSGLPVVIWKEAAEAKFVEENEVGIVVDSLQDLSKKMDSINSTAYFKLIDNIKKIKTQIQNGEYASRAIQECLRRI